MSNIGAPRFNASAGDGETMDFGGAVRGIG